jgi:hypothetical protein
MTPGSREEGASGPSEGPGRGGSLWRGAATGVGGHPPHDGQRSISSHLILSNRSGAAFTTEQPAPE